MMQHARVTVAASHTTPHNNVRSVLRMSAIVALDGTRSSSNLHQRPSRTYREATVRILNPRQKWKWPLESCNIDKLRSARTPPLSGLRFFAAANTDDRDISKLPLPAMNDVDILLQQSGIARDYIEKLGKQNPTPLRLKDMYEYGCTNDQKIQRLRNAQFLHRELPVRIAHRAIDLLTLPHGLSNAMPIKQVATIYLTLLRRIHDFPLPTNVDQEERFTDMLQTILLDRTSIPTSIAQGVQAWLQKSEDETSVTATTAASATTVKKRTAAEQYEYEDRLREMDQALARFFTARVGLRFLVEQYVLTSPRESAQSFRDHNGMLPVLQSNNNSSSSSSQNRLGCIQPNVDVAQEVRRIADIVAQQTKEYYNGLCPEINIVDCASDYDEFTFVPHHLQYMVSELLKNSCRASVRKYKEREAATVFGDATTAVTTTTTSSKITIPSIRVIIVKGSEDVTIKIADQGGGIPRSRMSTIWRFAHSTASMDEQGSKFGVEASSGARLRGFGLPLAEIYARYFGGELTLKSTEGYGLDAYLHLPRLGDACENLPLRVRDSPAGGVSLPTNADVRMDRTISMAASRPRTMGTRSIRSASRTYTAPMTPNEARNQVTPSVPMGALDLAAKMQQDSSTK